ncbi:penicillin-binding protein 1A [Thiomicrospira cyclica]|uniref:Penicillin-binding protein 1A n=1 Tax=Thiomicrospira cyclica (strain DSM 14477 / JCM 11371 / ALM1) TaxID=717773 RepID=F6DB57_THICA|nr:penicillin-binding protein 1A [Thiomicrospira cyclica]AEG30797.1 penicillin-binding protein, 1A family [Thiomicrospira cyclica ALM1]
MSRPIAKRPAPTPLPKRRWLRRLFLWPIYAGLLLTLLVATYAGYLYQKLPDPNSLKNVSYQVPLRIETSDGKVITEIGEKRRIPLEYPEIPIRMIQAIISAEDDRFYQHFGIDFKGIARATYELISTGSIQSGGSTITMQVARNFFLTRDRSFERKFHEIILSLKIEQTLTKQEIMALYLNQIFLGHRSYGVAAAAQTYYGKPIHELDIHEFAMIAGLPKAPSAFNPIANPARATLRRNYVLRRMHELGYITQDQFTTALAQPIEVTLTGVRIETEAGYIAEMARQFALERFGETALEQGLTIRTTIRSNHQDHANAALRSGLLEYDRRHGYRGHVAQLDPSLLDDADAIQALMREYPQPGGLRLGLVMAVNDSEAKLQLRNGDVIALTFNQANWARADRGLDRLGPAPTQLDQIFQAGDLVYLTQSSDNQWLLAQNPRAEAALVSINPRNGEIIALVGGFDFFKSRFNRVTQAKRQLGSAYKPFLYSGAFELGITAATVINDAPVVFHDAALEDIWRPENYTGRFYGPTRVREALIHSRNLVPIRLLQEVGVAPIINHSQRFGFDLAELNRHRNLSLALGSAQFTPLEAARAYAVFANGGSLIEPYFVREVRDFNGQVIYQANPLQACGLQCDERDPGIAPRAISKQNAFMITSILQDVIAQGTGRQAAALNRKDLAGKTGTTNQQFDAWFVGYNPDVVTSVWVGNDQPSGLGRRETAGRAALPIWIDYMRHAVADSPNIPFLQPEGLVYVPIDRSTGQTVPADTPGAYFELFYPDQAPEIPVIRPNNLRDLTRELFQ